MDSAERATTGNNLRENLGLIGLVMLTVLVFLPSLFYGFVTNLDDFAHVTENTHLALTWSNLGYWWTHPTVSVYMPVTMYSYMVDYFFWDKNPFGYHLQSLWWHVVMLLMIYKCFRACGISAGWSWLAAACWAIHPQRVESVVWISERKDVMCGAFYFWALYRYLKDDGTHGFNWSALALTTIALLCKPMAVSLPFIFMLIDFSRRQRWEWRHYVLRFWPYLAVVAGIALITLHYQVGGGSRHVELSRQIPVILHNLAWYSLQNFWPEGQRGIQPLMIPDTATIVTGIAVYLLAAAAIFLAWRNSSREELLFKLLPAIAAPLIVIAPVIGIFHLGFIDYADRYSYIPSAFIWFLLLQAVRWHGGWSRTWRYALAVTMFFLLIRFIMLTSAGLPAWRNYDALLQQAVSGKNCNEVALFELAIREHDRGNLPVMESIAARLESGVDQGIANDMSSGRFYATVLRSVAATGQGKYRLASQMIDSVYPALEPKSYFKPGMKPYILRHIINLSMQLHNFTRAQADIAQLLELYAKKGREKDYDFYYYSGLAAGLNANYELAVTNFREALKLQPQDIPATNNLKHAEMLLKNSKPAKQP